MIYFQSIWRSIVWLIIGALFGLASVLLILGSSMLFVGHLEIHSLIDSNIIVFLCIALMGGAGADFLLTGNYHAGWRVATFTFLFLLLMTACYIFSPNNKEPPTKNALFWIVWGYVIVAILYCIGLKSLLIYRERLNHLGSQRHNNQKTS
jgi:hypothetical protein